MLVLSKNIEHTFFCHNSAILRLIRLKFFMGLVAHWTIIHLLLDVYFPTHASKPNLNNNIKTSIYIAPLTSICQYFGWPAGRALSRPFSPTFISKTCFKIFQAFGNNYTLLHKHNGLNWDQPLVCLCDTRSHHPTSRL